MKKLVLAAVVSLVGLSAGVSQAANIGAGFNVTVALTSVCRVASGAPTALAFPAYTAFGATVNAAATDFTFECTRGYALAPTIAFDSGTDATTSAAGTTATGAGVVAGLNYTMAVGAAVVTAGAAATTSGIGGATTYKYSVTGNIPASQAGDTSLTASQARTLTITY